MWFPQQEQARHNRQVRLKVRVFRITSAGSGAEGFSGTRSWGSWCPGAGAPSEGGAGVWTPDWFAIEKPAGLASCLSLGMITLVVVWGSGGEGRERAESLQSHQSPRCQSLRIQKI